MEGRASPLAIGQTLRIMSSPSLATIDGKEAVTRIAYKLSEFPPTSLNGFFTASAPRLITHSLPEGGAWCR